MGLCPTPTDSSLQEPDADQQDNEAKDRILSMAGHRRLTDNVQSLQDPVGTHEDGEDAKNAAKPGHFTFSSFENGRIQLRLLCPIRTRYHCPKRVIPADIGICSIRRGQGARLGCDREPAGRPYGGMEADA